MDFGSLLDSSLYDIIVGGQGMTGGAPLDGQQSAPMPPQQQPPAFQQPHGFRNILGMLGDAISVGAGGQPLYHNRIAQQQQQAAAQSMGQRIQGYLGDSAAGLGDIFASDPDLAMKLYNAKNGGGQEGQPNIAKEVAYYKSIGRDDLANELLQRHAEGGPLIANNGDGTFTIVPQGMIHGQPQGSLPHVSSPEEAQRLPPGTKFIMPDGRVGTVPGGATGNTPSLPFHKVMSALINQESGGNGAAVSPKGALGSTQMLPETARQMAGKLGLAFRPDMLHSNDPAAINYQHALGQAYLQEGLERTGNLRDALRYYHGGPNTAQWGPKTNAYADAILAHLGRQ